MNAEVEDVKPDAAPLEDVKDSIVLQLEISNIPNFNDADTKLAVVKQDEPILEDNVIKTEPACNELEEKLLINAEKIIKDHSFAEVNLQLGSECDTVLPDEEVDVKSDVGDEISDEIITTGNTISKNAIYKCSVCNYSGLKQVYLRNHMKRHSTNKILFKCKEYSYKTISKNNTSRHRIRHKQDKRFKCNECDYTALYNCYLKRHEQTHLNDRPFKCNLCNYSSVHKHTLKKHMKRHTREENQFRCSICSFKTYNKESFNSHFAKHSAFRPLKCDQCDFRTSSEGYLSQHKNFNHTTDFKCDFCDYRVKNIRDLNSHLKNHPKNEFYKCSICNYITHVKQSLERHVFEYHSKTFTKPSYNPFEVPSASKLYRCDKCSFADKDINRLVLHMKVHLK